MLKGLGGMGDMMGLMKQAQKMKKDMKKIKKEISKTNITVSDKTNNITLVMNGDHIVQKITLSDEVKNIDTSKLELLLKEVVNQASRDIEKMSSEKMSILSKQGIPTDLPF
jgi:DNA-binding YbaB/EbfC family protein